MQSSRPRVILQQSIERSSLEEFKSLKDAFDSFCHSDQVRHSSLTREVSNLKNQAEYMVSSVHEMKTELSSLRYNVEQLTVSANNVNKEMFVISKDLRTLHESNMEGFRNQQVKSKKQKHFNYI